MFPMPEPALDASALALCRWIAEYYAVPLGVALRSALPILMTGAAVPHPDRKTRRIAVLRHDVPSLLRRDHLFARAPRQREVFEYLESVGGRSPVDHLSTHLACSAVRRARAWRTAGSLPSSTRWSSAIPFATREATETDGAHADARPAAGD